MIHGRVEVYPMYWTCFTTYISVNSWFALINLMKTGTGQSKYCNSSFHVVWSVRAVVILPIIYIFSRHPAVWVFREERGGGIEFFGWLSFRDTGGLSFLDVWVFETPWGLSTSFLGVWVFETPKGMSTSFLGVWVFEVWVFETPAFPALNFILGKQRSRGIHSGFESWTVSSINDFTLSDIQ